MNPTFRLALLMTLAVLSSCSREQAQKVIPPSLQSSSSSSFSTIAQQVEQMGVIDYNEHVRPILSNTCFHCHGPDANKREAGFAIHTFAEATKELPESPGRFAIVPGKPEESMALDLIFSQNKASIMPPADTIHKLSEKEKQILKRWVEQGANYKKHWAFIHPERNPPQEQKNNPWVSNPIDWFIAAKHQQEKLSPAAPASPEVWLRRVTLSLTGLPPTPQELTSFLTDQKTGAKERAVDRLLSSPRYGEHMALSWMEAARYADTDGYQNDNERQNWPWRDYVIQSFNANKGFDQFTIEQLAGDMLDKPTHAQLIATAFNRNHRQNSEGGALAEEFIIENVMDRVETVGSIYFGFTMSCARCHDHKYDPLSQKEVFQFSAYFNNIKENPTARGVAAHPVMDSFSLYASDEVKKLHRDRAERVKQLKHQTATVVAELKSKPKAPKNRKELNQLAIKDPRVVAIKKQVDQLSKRLQTMENADIASVMVMQEAPGMTKTYVLDRGQYTDPIKTEELTRSVPASLLGREAPPKDRLELARWMMSDKNPITARVIVNRLWMHHFGRGICSTPEDFGSQAAFPSHPKLLDWLAVEFRESGWDMKAMHKLIVLSSTYGQSSKMTSESLSRDPENIWLARGPRFRMSGFSIRDQALFASGLLHEQLGGPSVKPYQPHGLWNSMSHNKGLYYKPDKGNDLYRRSLYTYWKRAVNPPRQLLFDAAGRETCTVTQNRTNTPLQALALMNDVTFLEAARVLAQRAINDGGDPVDRIYQLVSGYQLKGSNRTLLEESYREFYDYYKEFPTQAKALVKVGNYPLSENLDITTLAALMSVAHIILNTDEVLTIE